MLLENCPEPAITQNYVREMYQTIRCDHLHDMTEMRKAFEKHLEDEPGDKGAMERIRLYEATDCDEDRALQTLSHYWTWHRSVYRNALPYYLQVYYYSWYKAEKLFAAIGIFSTTLFALKKSPVIAGIIRAQRKSTASHLFRSSSHPRICSILCKIFFERSREKNSQALGHG